MRTEQAVLIDSDDIRMSAITKFVNRSGFIDDIFDVYPPCKRPNDFPCKNLFHLESLANCFRPSLCFCLPSRNQVYRMVATYLMDLAITPRTDDLLMNDIILVVTQKPIVISHFRKSFDGIKLWLQDDS